MGFSASDVVPLTQARANLPELADQANRSQRSQQRSQGQVVNLNLCKQGSQGITESGL
jgi:hypothetical protein